MTWNGSSSSYRSHGSSANGVYGLKAFAEGLDALESAGWTNRLPGLYWVYLHRADLLGQAISLVIAKQTGQWRSNARSHETPHYDARAIAAELAALARDGARWRTYFAQRGLQPLELTYEALSADPQAAAESVAALMSLGVPVTIDPARVDVAVQRDGVSREWRARFLAQPAEVPAVTVTRRPRLTVSIMTKDSQERLPRLLAEAREYADEVIVGVDAASPGRHARGRRGRCGRRVPVSPGAAGPARARAAASVRLRRRRLDPLARRRREHGGLVRRARSRAACAPKRRRTTTSPASGS